MVFNWIQGSDIMIMERMKRLPRSRNGGNGHDDTGPTAMEGLVRNLEEDRRFVSDAFWKKLERMIGSSAAHPPVQDAPADPAEAESAQQPS